ncbi:cytochrome b [Chromobacterium sp. IIBBL 290-4]|uniref:cytochrome b n=1 Tax=Chromobacterium sp. IIBBL 290-4 TaxID=2953890 RepID=UPI0020B653E4|nr:cytochrome b/b6 domain-containing protein [Chromobacterium sp. IIBBL 290-4]UTH76641.1 cytochrome b/b6 domain-containing protein [Chromobacterium sp. IIBBL 290-4]
MSEHARYPLSMRLLHWLLALLVFSNFALAWLLEDEESLLAAHKMIGAWILLLAAARLANKLRLRKRLPASVNPAGSWSYWAEKLAHGLLYLCLLAEPLLGWLKTNAAGHGATLFPGFDLPALMEKNRHLSHWLGGMHEVMASLLALLIALHVAAAFWHWINGSGLGLARMLPMPGSKREI